MDPDRIYIANRASLEPPVSFVFRSGESVKSEIPVSDLETRNEPCERELAGRALLNRVTKSRVQTHERSSAHAAYVA